MGEESEAVSCAHAARATFALLAGGAGAACVDQLGHATHRVDLREEVREIDMREMRK